MSAAGSVVMHAYACVRAVTLIATKVNSFAKTFAVGAQKLGYT